MTRALAIGAAVLAAIAGLLFYFLLDVHEQLGSAKLAAAVNGATIKTMEANEVRNVEIDKHIEAALQKTAATTREVMRAINTSSDTGACAKSEPIRALDGLRRPNPGDKDVGQAPAAAAPKPLHPPGR